MDDKKKRTRRKRLKAKNKTTKAVGRKEYKTTIISLQQLLVGLQQEAAQTGLVYELTLQREQVR
jgi:hypothetical protein